MTVRTLVDLTQTFQMELDNITAQTTALNTDCLSSSVPTAACSNIPTTSYMVELNYSAVVRV